MLSQPREPGLFLACRSSALEKELSMPIDMIVSMLNTRPIPTHQRVKGTTMRFMHMANAALWCINALVWLGYAHSIPMAIASAAATIGSIAMWHLARYD